MLNNNNANIVTANNKLGPSVFNTFHSFNNGFNKSIIPESIIALKSCIEADDPKRLFEIIQDNKLAASFSLYCCITLIPALKCIEYLISNGASMNRTFNNSPYGNVTPQQYMDEVYSSTSPMSLKTRQNIVNAIARGEKKRRKVSYDEHIGIVMYS
jgi:hypothetical protein